VSVARWFIYSLVILALINLLFLLEYGSVRIIFIVHFRRTIMRETVIKRRLYANQRHAVPRLVLFSLVTNRIRHFMSVKRLRYATLHRIT